MSVKYGAFCQCGQWDKIEEGISMMRPKTRLSSMAKKEPGYRRSIPSGIKKALAASDDLCSSIKRRRTKWVSVIRDLKRIRLGGK
jgi:hypothetical protein